MKKEDAQLQQSIILKAMFGEEFAKTVDPNTPGGAAYYTARDQKKRNAIKSWLSMGGNIALKDMCERVKLKTIECVGLDRTKEDGRERSCLMLDDIKRSIEFIISIEKAITKEVV